MFDYDAQPKEMLSECNLCGGHRFKPLSNVDRYGLPVSAVKCRGCGLQFINPRMTKEAYREFYEKGIYRDLVAKLYAGEQPATIEFLEFHQRNYALKVLKHLKGLMNGRGRKTLLDVGGSTGVVAEVVSKMYGLEATVMEPSDKEADRAEGRGLRVIRSTIEDYMPAGETFDVILLCQTVDHLMDIMGSLRSIRGMLAEGGLFFMDATWNTPVKVDHPFYLDDLTAPEYLRRAGFRIVREYGGPQRKRLNYVCEAP